jgi:hypothetical protein
VKIHCVVDIDYIVLVYYLLFTFSPTEEEAKEVHKCLRTAAGLFEFAKVNVGILQRSYMYKMYSKILHVGLYS